MAIKKAKPAAKGKPTKRAKAKPAKGGKVKQVAGMLLEAGMDFVPGGGIAKAGAKIVGKAAAKGLQMKGKVVPEGKKRRRRGVVPKTVKKWATRYAKKRKQTDKVIRQVFGTDGSKLTGPRKRRVYGGSPGVITPAEVREAMRR